MDSMTTFSSHLEAIHQLEAYYGDATLGNLIRHSKQVVKDVELYRDIYTLFNEDNEEELNKLFEQEGFYAEEDQEDQAEEE